MDRYVAEIELKVRYKKYVMAESENEAIEKINDSVSDDMNEVCIVDNDVDVVSSEINEFGIDYDFNPYE